MSIMNTIIDKKLTVTNVGELIRLAEKINVKVTYIINWPIDDLRLLYKELNG